jgi:NADPH-dependent glutamate synthase beta subunit-like oxidoreductase/2,4-dienoyl-CoA reductase-like NADH-dependent reductase (Old Yellow Enzyme family)
MARHRRFHLKDVGLLRAELSSLGLSLPIEEDLSVLGEPLTVAGHVLPNRFAVLPMEGFDAAPDGSPGPLAFRRYQRYAEGGSGLIWFEATAVLHEARSNPHQLVLDAATADAFARLLHQTRQAARRAFGHELLLVLQLTHSGRYSKPAGLPRPMIAHHSAVLDPKHNLPPDYPLVTDDYLDRLQDVYVEAARLAARAGFDGVDVKGCHRYLVSELLASFTRPGKYGGSLENRSRWLLEVIGRIRDGVAGLLVTTRINVYDAIPYPYGFGVDRHDHEVPDLAEPIEVLRQLRDLGIPLANPTIGNPYYNPHYGRPYDRPVAGVEPPDEHPLAGVVRFLQITRQVQEAFPELPAVGSGYSWLRHLMPYVAAGVLRQGWARLIGQGRGAFAYPDSVKDILTEGRMKPEKTCVTCSGCSQIMRDGTMTGCVVRDRRIYAEQYRLGRRYALDRLLEQARRCRDCEFAPCTAGCPAHVDVPAFVRAFADGRIQEAYDVLRRSNVLPEMCACVCPAEVQCEGGCLEQIFEEHALPIRDLQLAVSRLARQSGMTSVRLPAAPTGRRVAVVGGGPAGLACAIRLLEKGHLVTLLEQSERLGGTPDQLIPLARFGDAREEIDAILTPARQAGRIEIQLGRALGGDLSLDQLRRQFDAVFLAIGLGQPASLGKAQGVVDALSFLRDAKRGASTPLSGFRVAVLGAGNTAVDAALTAKRLGAAQVYVVYRRSLAEMPAWPEERRQLLESACHVLILTQTLGYQTDAKGRLTALRIARTELGEPDASGRRSPRVVPGTEGLLPVEMAIEALGQSIPAALREAIAPIGLTPHGLVATRPGGQATSLPGVYAGGDLTSGGTTAAQGIAEGMRAADEIDRQLCGEGPR